MDTSNGRWQQAVPPPDGSNRQPGAAQLSRDSVNATRMMMEQQLMEIISGIPVGPKSALLQFQAEKLEQLARSNVAFQSLEQQQIQHAFSNLPKMEHRALEQRAAAEFQQSVASAYEKLREYGPKYFEACEQSGQMPLPQIVPSTQVAIFSGARHMPPLPQVTPVAPKPPRRPSRPGAKRQMDEMFETMDIDDGDVEGGPLPVAPDDVSLQVVCNDVYGLLNPATCKVVHKGQTMTATQFEAFAGSGSAKKWKSSLRIVPGQVPECPSGAQPMPVGKWLDMRGWVAKGSRQGKPKILVGVTSAAVKTATPPQPKQPTPVAPKPPKEEGPPPWERMQQGDYEVIRVKWSGDRCAVCSSEVDYDTDQLLHCHGCGIAVHQSCYGVRDLPKMEDKWVCRACEAVLEGKPRPHCAVCPVEGGALKPTTLPGLWCHVACMQWIPELGVNDTDTMEPIQGIENIERQRWSLTCSICKQRCGAMVQCNKCCTAFHPLCGRLKGLTMEMHENAHGSHLPLVSTLYCQKHCTPNAGAAGVQYLMAEEDGMIRAPASELINCFPYSMPPAVPLPRPKAGCCRAQPWVSVTRVRDGTGVGSVTTEAWWIPTEADIVPDEADGTGQPGPSTSLAPVRMGRKRRLTGSSSAPAAKVSKPKGPPPKVDLGKLPDGVPEEVPIFCNGRTALLLIRQQKVFLDGELMPPSRFEQVCGKGDAKKWKATLFHFNTIKEQPTVCMQEWLANHKLDRAYLQRMKENYEGHSAWLAWERTKADDADAVDAQPDEEATPEIVGKAASHLHAADPQNAGEAPPGAAERQPAVGPESCGDAGKLPAADHATGTERLRAQVAMAHFAQDDAQEGGRYDAVAGAPASLETRVSHPTKAQATGCAVAGCRFADCLPCGHASEVVPATPIPCPAGGVQAGGVEAGADEGDPDARGEDGSDIIPGPWGLWKARSRAIIPLASEPGKFSYDFQAVHVLQQFRDSLTLPRRKGDLESWVGRCVRVFWPNDTVWYSADIIAWRPQTSTHILLYHTDDEEEELDLAAEERQRRIQWLPSTDSANWPPPPNPPIPLGRPPAARPLNGELHTSDHDPSAIQCNVRLDGTQSAERDMLGSGCNAAGSQVTQAKPENGSEPASTGDQLSSEAGHWGTAGASVPPPSGVTSVGWRVEVFWEEGDMWCKGVVEAFEENLNRYKIHFDDGDMQWVDSSMCPLRWLTPDARQEASEERSRVSERAARTAAEALTKAQAEAAQRAQNAPDVVDIICNGRRAQLLVRETAVIMENGNRVSPTEFERISGKGAAKKWKGSIRVRLPEGQTGPTIGEWLIQAGLEVNRGALLSAVSAPRRRFPSRRANNTQSGASRAMSFVPHASRGAGGQGASSGVALKRRHRPDCMCIICKQARRKVGGASLESLSLSTIAAAPQAIADSSLGDLTQARRPAHRLGKHAYLNSTAYVPRGCAPPGEIPFSSPSSRSWDPEEWAVYWQLHGILEQDFEGGISAEASGDAASSFIDPALEQLLQPPGPYTAIPQVVEKGTLRLLGIPMHGASDGPLRLGLPSAKDKVLMCRQTLRHRLTINKSGIHGWGMTAICNISQDSMVIEYCGESVRPALQDVKEKNYQRKGVDVYLFALSEAVVVDATKAGSIARFTNACCDPCLYSKIMDVDGKPKLMFFAKSDIQAGQEITYDYRFRAQEGRDLTPCQCGAPTCRGTLEVAFPPPILP